MVHNTEFVELYNTLHHNYNPNIYMKVHYIPTNTVVEEDINITYIEEEKSQCVFQQLNAYINAFVDKISSSKELCALTLGVSIGLIVSAQFPELTLGTLYSLSNFNRLTLPYTIKP